MISLVLFRAFFVISCLLEMEDDPTHPHPLNIQNVELGKDPHFPTRHDALNRTEPDKLLRFNRLSDMDRPVRPSQCENLDRIEL